MKQVSENGRIAKNAVMLYIRMLISVVVSLYTSRVVLKTLGVEDYGIYGVVGGVVAMFSFLNSSMAGATSRFLTFELGRGKNGKLDATFSSALMVHIGIALLICSLSESIGLWFLNHKLVIPEGRIDAAHWVFQCSILSMVVGVTQIPYNATIIAHEKMDVYAYVELLNVFLKLGIVYVLSSIGNIDKLILYSLLMLGVSIFIAIIYRIYCLKHFRECHFHWIWDREILKPMISFSGWDLFGNMTFVAKQQGTNFLVNIFYGVAVNGASGIATTVQGIIQGFSNNILQAFRPVIIKDYAKKNFESLQYHLESAVTYSFLFLVLVSVPLIFGAECVLDIWLVDVPEYAANFCQILLVNNLIVSITTSFLIPIHASGKIRRMSLIGGIIGISTLVFIYSALKITTKFPSVVYLVTVAISIVMCVYIITEAKRCMPQIIISRLLIRPFIILLIGTICYLFLYFLVGNIQGGILGLCIVSLCSCIFIGGLSYFFVLTADERSIVKKWLKNKII